MTMLSHDIRLAMLGAVGRVDEKTMDRAVLLGVGIAGGSINKKDGRVRIFVKGRFPGAHRSGYALRSRVVWWINTGEVIKGRDVDIHHENEDRTDDSFSNLKKLSHEAHAAHHNPRGTCDVERTCKTCGKPFLINQWRLKGQSRGSFCSPECFQKRPRNKVRIHKVCVACGKSFHVIPSRERKALYCSHSCGGKVKAEKRWHRS